MQAVAFYRVSEKLVRKMMSMGAEALYQAYRGEVWIGVDDPLEVLVKGKKVTEQEAAEFLQKQVRANLGIDISQSQAKQILNVKA